MNNISIKSTKYFVSVLSPLLYLILLYYQKYSSNNLAISEFNLFSIGNLFNLFLILGIVIGLTIYFGTNQPNKRAFTNVFLIFSIVSLLPIIIVQLLYFINFQFPDRIIFNFPVKKVYFGFLYVSSAAIQLFLLILIWTQIVEKGKLYILKSLLTLFGAILLILLFSLTYTIFEHGKINVNDRKKYDIGIVLGAAVWQHDKPSPIFEGRIVKCYDLYKEGKVKRIQLTGGNAPGEVSEAEAAEKYLLALGVNEKDILVENNTATTSEQINFIKNSLSKYNSNKIVIFTDQFHMNRVLEMCKFFNIDADGVESNYNVSWEKLILYRTRESVALLLFWFFGI